MKILIPTADYPPIEGGIGTVALQVSRELAGLGHEVTVIAPYFPGMKDFDASEPAHVIRFRGYALGWLRLFPMLWTTLRHRNQGDLVLAINVSHAGLISCLLRKPYIAFAYAYEFLKFERRPLIAGLLRYVYSHARFVVAISKFTRDNLIDFGVSENRIKVILPGAPEARSIDNGILERVREQFILEDGPVILAVGRFMPRKGHVTLVQAMPELIRRFPGAVLVLVGRGPYAHKVTREAWALGVRDHVRITGWIDDDELAALYQLCDVFALPTGKDERGQVEGFGLVFAEAHAYGKPVVAGRSGGVVDAVLDGETGLIIEPDDPEALANAVGEILSDPGLAKRLGEAGRQRVADELNWKMFSQRLMECAEELP